MGSVAKDPCTKLKVQKVGPQRQKMGRSMPGLPNTWEYDLQKAQGGLIGSHIANKGDIGDPGPRTGRGLDPTLVCMDSLRLVIGVVQGATIAAATTH